MNFRRVLLLLMPLALLGGCSALAPRLERPELRVIGVELVRADLLRQELRVRMHVRNPNDRELPVRGIDYVVELAGEQLAHGESAREFTVPALGEAEFDLNVFANAAPAMLKFLAASGREPLEYRISGTVRLASGLLRTLPFSEKGLINLR